MKKVFYYNILILLYILLSGFKANAQCPNEKSITRSFPMTNAGQLVLENKYGTIEVQAWKKDSIRIEISIKAVNKPENYLEKISYNFDTSEEFVNVHTEIEGEKKGFLYELIDELTSAAFENGSVNIDYKIYLPEFAKINLDNKYGDITTHECKGKINVNLAHGDLRLNGEIEDLELLLRFGTLRTHKMNTADLDIKNGSAYISSVNDLRLKSAGSEIEIDRVDDLRIKSSKDQIRLESVEKINGEIRFTKLKIDTVAVFCDLSLYQADFTIRSLSKEQATINIEQSFSDVEINSNNTGIDIAARLHGGNLRLPQEVKNLKVDLVDKEEEIRNVSATLGEGPFSKIDLKGKKGYIFIK